MPSVPEGSPGDAVARVDDAVQPRAVLQRQGLADSAVRASASKDRRRPVGTKIAKKQHLERLSADGEAQSFHSNEDGKSIGQQMELWTNIYRSVAEMHLRD